MSTENTALKTAFRKAAYEGAMWGGMTALVALFTGDFSLVLPAVIISSFTAGGVAYGYEKKIEAQKEAARANSRPSEGPGW